MTRTEKFIGLLIIVALASTGCHHMRRNIGGMTDHSGIERYSSATEFRHMRRTECGQTGSDNHFMHEGSRHWMSGNGWRGRMPFMRRGMGPMGSEQLGRIERIPGLTDTQRKEIDDLRVKQMQEMDKLREETFAKMQSLREENRSKLMSLLTDEQKKFLETGPSAGSHRTPPATK